MEKLTIEQKAQRYDEAINVAKSKIKNDKGHILYERDIINIFPELKESEDEKIRELLLDNFKSLHKACPNGFYRDGITYNSVIAWLEKQGKEKREFFNDSSYENMFPTNTSTEDDIRRRSTIQVLEYARSLDTYNQYGKADIDKNIAWLKKQETPYTKRDVDDAYLKGVTDTKNEIEKQYEANYQIRKDIATFIFNYRGDIKDRAKWMNYLGIKVCFVEQKPADKVEPKFKAGNWYQCIKDFFGKGVRFDKGNAYYCGQDGCLQEFDSGAHIAIVEELYEYFRLWTIQDAKDGDVLFMDNGVSNCIFIYKSSNNGIINKYASYNKFGLEGEHYLVLNDGYVIPTTKEQRDALEKAMADAGYTFDFEKKELKKIENEIEIPFGAKDSELQEVTYFIPKGFHAEIDDDKVVIKKGEKPTEWSEEDEKIYQSIMDDTVQENQLDNRQINWLKSFKERVLTQPKQEWSEEDENRFSNLIFLVKSSGENEATKKGFIGFINRLKSLRPQPTWKPSDEQMKALNFVVNLMASSASPKYSGYYYNVFKNLRKQLKKLMEE